MIYLIVGHRGSGKTTLLGRLEKYYREAKRPCETLDLDELIEAQEGLPVKTLFEKNGEQNFRQLEEESLFQLCAQQNSPGTDLFIGLGAGYNQNLPDNAKVLWLRRPTDLCSRVFIDRPRLNTHVTPPEEYLERLLEREFRFAEWADFEFTLAEGFEDLSNPEAVSLGIKEGVAGGQTTLLPWQLKDEKRWSQLLPFFRSLGVTLELRDDLLSSKAIEMVEDTVSSESLLYSVREKNSPFLKRNLAGKMQVDWAWELGQPPKSLKPTILSNHNHQTPMSASLPFEKEGAHIKRAEPISSWKQLWEGHRWWLDSPSTRSFLPSSETGRWSWYRLLHGQKMKASFWRFGRGSCVDQPTLFDWLRCQDFRGFFAAVLGDPVEHSRTPAEHFEYFRSLGWPVVAIPLKEEEMNHSVMEILWQLGLRAAAVTSPLKEKAYQWIKQEGVVSDIGHTLQSVNTIQWNEKGQTWRATNTDQYGFERVMAPYKKLETIAVWGGGGTRAMMMSVLPQAHFYSARTGQPISASPAPRKPSPSLLVWAVSRSRMEQCQWPPAHWTPSTVMDLNYSQDSPGREYILRSNQRPEYVSGLGMFKAQAQAQREFFEEK